ncbi:MAG: hypothetical protein ABSF98_14995 [Bryobacteraceae bacterium]
MSTISVLPNLKRLRVLFVDDEPFAMSFFREDLESDNMEVRFLDSAEAAHEAFGSGSCDIAILDSLMDPGPYQEPDARPNVPAKTGISLLQDFRSKHPLTPVIILTNVSDARILAEIEKDPLVKVIQKVKVLPSEFPAIVRSFAEGQ